MEGAGLASRPSLPERMCEALDSCGILVLESEDAAPCTEQLESLGISFDEFVENAGRSRLGELPAVSS